MNARFFMTLLVAISLVHPLGVRADDPIKLAITQGGSQTVAARSGTAAVFAPIIVTATDTMTGNPAADVAILFTTGSASAMVCSIAADGNSAEPVVATTDTNGVATLAATPGAKSASCQGSSGTAFVVAEAGGVQTFADLTVVSNSTPAFALTPAVANQSVAPASMTCCAWIIPSLTFTMTDVAGDPVTSQPVALMYLTAPQGVLCYMGNGGGALQAVTDANGAVTVPTLYGLNCAGSPPSTSIPMPMAVAACSGDIWGYAVVNLLLPPPGSKQRRGSRPVHRASSAAVSPAICSMPQVLSRPKRVGRPRPVRGSEATVTITAGNDQSRTLTGKTVAFSAITARVTDSAGDAIPGADVTFSVAAVRTPNVISCSISRTNSAFKPVVVVTGSDGTATLDQASGRASATCGHGSGDVAVIAATTHAQATAALHIDPTSDRIFTIVSGDNQSVPQVNGSWPFAPVVVNVSDAAGKPLAGQSVSLSVIAPFGQFCLHGDSGDPPQDIGTTDANGNVTLTSNGSIGFICFGQDGDSRLTPSTVIAVVAGGVLPVAVITGTELPPTRSNAGRRKKL